MLSTEQFRVNEPSVIHQVFGEEVVAVHLTTGTYHTLSATAGEVFLMLSQAGASLSHISVRLANKYEAEVDVIEKDLEEFMRELQQESLVVPVSRPVADQAIPILRSEAQRAPYAPPRLESFSDLQELFLLDPVHDVGAAGWPNAAPTPPTESGSETEILGLMRCRLAGPNVIFERFDSETIAMNLGTGAYHSLSGAAEDIFLLFPHEPTTWEIRKALGTKFAVELHELESAIREYLDQLMQEGLIVLEAVDGNAPERALELSRPGAGEPFNRPRLETYAQPTSDTPLGDEAAIDSGLYSSLPGDPVSTGTEFNPYVRRCYSVRRGDLLYSAADGQIVISDRDSGRYFKLDRAASVVFRELASEADVNQLVAALEHEYEASEKDLRAAVMILLLNLRKLGLAVLSDGGLPKNGDENAARSTGKRLPFRGFDVAVYHDLKDLLLPYNPSPAVQAKPQTEHVRQFLLRQFLLSMETYFEETANAHGSTEGAYSVAGRAMRVRCAGGEQTAQFLKAFEHLATDRARNGLTIHAWHHSAISTSPWLETFFKRLYENWPEICGPRGEVLELHCDSVAVVYHPGPDTLSVVDKQSGKAFFLMRNDASLPFWEVSSPFRHILHPWFSSLGLQYTHAGAVGGPEGGVLLAGKGGSGKSTTSLLCAAAGMLYAADDYCLTDAEGAQVFSLYNTAKLKGPEDLERVPALRGRSLNSDSFERGGMGKGAFSLSALWPERMTPGFPIRAILLPQLTIGKESRLEPCSPADALLALAPSTLAQLPISGQTDCDRLAALAEKIPAFRLHLGSDLDGIPAQVRKFVG